MTDSTLSALLRACVLAPADAAPRLVLADYLEEGGRLDADRAATLRDGRGEWLIGPHRQAVWWFRDGSAQSTVGEVPADIAPSCRACATLSNLRHLGDMWLCSHCRFGAHGARDQSVMEARTDGPVLVGDPVCVAGDGRVRRATAADRVVGFRIGSALACLDGHTRVLVRLS